MSPLRFIAPLRLIAPLRFIAPLRRIFSSDFAARRASERATARPRNAIILTLALLLLVAGCGVPPSQSWGSVVNNDGEGLFLVYLDRVTLLNVDSDGANAHWQYPPPGAETDQSIQFYALPALTEDTIFVGGYDRKVYALTREHGTEQWVFSGTEEQPIEDRIIGGLAVGHGNVYFGVANHGVFAIDQEDGAFQWYHSTDHGVWATPLVLADQVIVTSLDHNIYSLDPETGDVLWQRDLEGAVVGTPAYDEDSDILYIGSFANKLFALAADGGETLFTYDTEGWVWDGPVLSGGALYFGDMDGYFYALEPDFGAEDFVEIWQPRAIASSGIRAAPLVAGGYIVVGSRGGADRNTVYVLERETGEQVWAKVTGADVLATPVLTTVEDEDIVVVSTLNPSRVLIAYRLEGGVELWQYPVPQAEQ